MAQIRLEEKKGGSILPWIIGLLLLALIIWGVAEAFDDEDVEETYTEEVVPQDNVVAPVANDVDYMTPVAAYMATTEDMEGEMGLDHEFSHEALTELVEATVAVAKSKGVSTDATSQSKVDQVKQLADDITKDPLAGDHADKIKMAALMIVDMFQSIDMETNDNQASTDIGRLRSEAEGITKETLTLNQKEDVRSFFGQARKVLQDMI